MILQAPLIASCFVPITQYATKMTLDRLVEWETFMISDLTVPILLFVMGQVIAESSWALSNWVNFRSIVSIKRDLTHQVYSYVLDLAYRFFQESFSGTISAKIENIQTISNKVFENIKFNIINRVTVLLSTVFLFLIVSKVFLFLLLAFYAIFFPTVYCLSRKLHGFSEDYTSKKQKTSGLIVDSIGNIFSVFLFSNRKKEKLQIKKGLETVLISEKKMLRYEWLLQLLIGGIYLSMSIGVLFLLIYMRQQGKITVGDFALILGALFHMLEVSYSLVTNITDLVKDWGELKESFSLFKGKLTNSSEASLKPLVIKSPSITLSHVTFGYSKEDQILSDLSLDLKPGEKVGLVGHSGAGKSTLIHLLLRYFTPEKGSILIDSQNINEVSETSLRESISVVPQETLLFHRSIKENIAYSKPGASHDEIIQAAKRANIYRFIETLPEGFETLVGERGIKLSGGQRQRIAIARAFLKKAPILILDEATSQLDSRVEREIQESLEELVQEKTVIAIAHRLSTLKQMDRILFLEKGRILEEGTHDTLIQNPEGAYHNLWNLQNMPLLNA
ncbi:ABC transporter ATP-binding protein [Candidatus Neptunochlamydia vexilliferae]|uniref:ABC transporter ATP-binding protein n=1 Tax=Candidatus Neptunichlamydia vexilliferae TaxID=1651774 RepID=UPI0018912295|nr:ABC transporter ATP-binding protein [Candidatus Neptunochlamydia vexilliferae]